MNFGPDRPPPATGGADVASRLMTRALDIGDWLDSVGLGKYRDRFRQAEIGVDVLPMLTEQDLRELDVPLGDRKRFMAAIAAVQPAQEADDSERRQVTVLFCDLVGFTDLSNRLDPEDLEAVVAGFVATCEAEVNRWGGHVANYLGDGLLVYFGWPRAHEDAADRAVHAGLAITAAVGGQTAPDGASLAARVGVATGVVLIGKRMGEGAAQVETVFGATPNLAARLEALAAPGDVMIGATTRQILRNPFTMEDTGNHAVKGFADPVRVWRVTGQADGAHADTHGAGGLLGRASQLAALDGIWREVVDGHDLHMVLISGEAGMGKSRLISHFRAGLEERPHRTVLTQCWPYKSDRTLYPFVDHLRQAAGILAGDAPARAAGKLDALARKLGLDPDVQKAALSDLLEITTTATGRTAHQRKADWFDGVAAYLRACAASDPVLLVVEDGHWIDPVSEEFLEQLPDLLADCPVMVAVTGRLEYMPVWAQSGTARHVDITRLDDTAARVFISQIAAERVLSPALFARIVATTDGVPLFIEELTRSILDRSDGLRDDGPASLDIPATLHDVLVARLDQTRAAKRTAQTASCIGRVFARDLLEAVSDLPRATIEAHLDALVAADIILPETVAGKAHFSFRHALIQEAAYQSQLKSHRRAVHGTIAEAIARERDPDPVVLANHCSAAGRFDEALGHWRVAAGQARERSALREAISHGRRALQVLENLPATQDRDRAELELLLALGPDLAATEGYGSPSVRETYDRAEKLAHAIGAAADLFALRRGQWMFAQMSAAYDAAERAARQMHGIAARMDEPGLMLEADRALGATSFVTGNLADARRHLESGLPNYAEGRSGDHTGSFGDDPGLASLSYLGRTLWFLGYPDQSLARCNQALDIALRVEHPFSLARTYVFVAHSHQLRGEIERLALAAGKAMEISDRYGFPFFAGVARLLSGWGMVQAGRQEEGDALMTRGYGEYQSSDSQMSKPWFLMLLADADRVAGRLDRAMQRIDEALSLRGKTGENLVGPECLRVRGTIHAAAGDQVRAVDQCMEARDLAVAQGSRSCELRAAMTLAELDPSAGPLVAEAIDWFVEGFDTADLKRARGLMAALT